MEHANWNIKLGWYAVLKERNRIMVGDINSGIKFPIWVYLNQHIYKSKGITNQWY